MLSLASVLPSSSGLIGLTHVPATQSRAAAVIENACRFAADLPGDAGVPTDQASDSRGVSGAVLPNELWGEIASFSSYTDILNLRVVCANMRLQADTAIRAMTLSGDNATRSFADAVGFTSVTKLRLVDVHSRSLHYLAHCLAERPRENLSIGIVNSHRYLVDGLARLSELLLSGLELANVSLTPSVVEALGSCRYPLALAGEFYGKGLVDAVSLPTLTKLSVASFQMNDEVAGVLSGHGKVAELSLRGCYALSAAGLACIASMPALHTLTLDNVDYADRAVNASGRITADVARNLAANTALQKLVLGRSSDLISEEALEALSQSMTLTSLTMSNFPKLHHLHAMTSLRELTLSAPGPASAVVDIGSAGCISTLPNLQSLTMDAVRFEAGALRSLLASVSVKKLQLIDVLLCDDDVLALLSHQGLDSLTLLHVGLAPEYVRPLSEHPALAQLSIGERGESPVLNWIQV